MLDFANFLYVHLECFSIQSANIHNSKIFLEFLKVIVLLTIPILGVLVAFGLYFYMRTVYRKIVDEVDSIRVTTKWTDIEAFKPTIYKSLPLPSYLSKIEEQIDHSFSFQE